MLLAGKIEVMGVIGPAGGGAPTASNALLQFTHLAGAPSTWSNPVWYRRRCRRRRRASSSVATMTESTSCGYLRTAESGQHWNLSRQAKRTVDYDWLGFFNAEPRPYYTPLRDSRVVYRGDDAHIHELWLTTGSAPGSTPI